MHIVCLFKVDFIFLIKIIIKNIKSKDTFIKNEIKHKQVMGQITFEVF